MEAIYFYCILFLTGTIFGGWMTAQIFSRLSGHRYDTGRGQVVVTSSASGAMVWLGVFALLVILGMIFLHQKTTMPNNENTEQRTERPMENTLQNIEVMQASFSAKKVNIPPPQPQKITSESHYLQLAAFTEKAAAERYRRHLTDHQNVDLIGFSPKTFAPYKVLIGPFASARDAAAHAHRQNLKAFIVSRKHFSSLSE